MREYFSSLYGNRGTKKRLAEAILENSLAHALLIVGDEGSGKKTLALEIAAALNCENKSSSSHALPCGRCNTCKRIREGNYTDITRLKRERDKATIGVEEVRLFREDMFLSATESNFKLYIIEEADKLTVNAQNALLTVLEEPPRNVIIILLTKSQDKILTTIKSRAQSIFMEHFSPEALKEYLLSSSDKARLLSKVRPEAFEGILMSSDGRIGKALSLTSEKDAEENAEDRLTVERVVEKMCPSVPYSELYTALSSLPTARAEFSEALETVVVALRDLLLIKQDSGTTPLFYTSRQKAEKLCEQMSTKRLLLLYDFTRGAIEDTSKNVSVGAIISDLGVKIKLI